MREIKCGATGINDKNGKEIYRGDIIEFANVIDGKNIRRKVDMNFKVFRKILEYTNQCYVQIELIGNINENPELSKKGT